MTNSYNGFKASRNPADFGGLDNSVIPSTDGVKFAPGIRAGNIALIFFWLGWQWNIKIERLITPGCWGFFYKMSANSKALVSCHSGGTAGDFNAPMHPNGRRGTMNGPSLIPGLTKIQVLRELLAYLEGVLYWGGDAWGNGTPDEMHCEIATGTLMSKIDAVAAKILRDYGPRETWASGVVLSPPTNTAPPASTGSPVASKWHDIAMGGITDLYAHGEQVMRDQADLIDSGFSVGSGGADGYAGDDTISAIRNAQGALGILVDGRMGPDTRNGIHRIPSYGLPDGHYWGDIHGPANIHGGINPSERAKVDAIQDRLIIKGYAGTKTRDPNATTWDDGKFEGATTEAVKRLQRDEGLAADGLVGPVTWTRLFR